MTLISLFRKFFTRTSEQTKPQQQQVETPKPRPRPYIAKAKHLRLDNIPFTPSDKQIIYIEGAYNDEVNNFIKENIVAISAHFNSCGYEFCYVPHMLNKLTTKEIFGYYAPYATAVAEVDIDSGYLLSELSDEQRGAIAPSLLYHSVHFKVDNTSGKPCFKYINIDLSQLSNDFSELIEFIKNDISNSEPRYSLIRADDFEPLLPFEYTLTGHKASIAKTKVDEEMCSDEIPELAKPKRSFRKLLRGKYESVNDRFISEDEWDDEIDTLLNDLNKVVERLSQKGFSEHLLMQLISQPKTISHVVITRDYRIMLSDYNNMEIVMTPIVKAVYFLFLRHPEGIVFKHLGDYRNELQHLYECIKGEPATEKMLQSIEDATNPYKNSINEKVARIREAFVSRFDERLATNYIINGERGEAKNIPLNRELVKWE